MLPTLKELAAQRPTQLDALLVEVEKKIFEANSRGFTAAYINPISRKLADKLVEELKKANYEVAYVSEDMVAFSW